MEPGQTGSRDCAHSNKHCYTPGFPAEANTSIFSTDVGALFSTRGKLEDYLQNVQEDEGGKVAGL